MGKKNNKVAEAKIENPVKDSPIAEADKKDEVVSNPPVVNPQSAAPIKADQVESPNTAEEIAEIIESESNEVEADESDEEEANDEESESDEEDSEESDEDKPKRKSKEEKITEYVESLEGEVKENVNNIIDAISSVKTKSLALPALKNVVKHFSLQRVKEIVDPDSESIWIRVHKSYLNVSDDAEKVAKKIEAIKKEIAEVEASMDVLVKTLEEDKADYEDLKAVEKPTSRDLKFKRDFEKRAVDAKVLADKGLALHASMDALNVESDKEKPTISDLLDTIAEKCNMEGGIDEFLGQQALVALNTPKSLRTKKSE